MEGKKKGFRVVKPRPVLSPLRPANVPNRICSLACVHECVCACACMDTALAQDSRQSGDVGR